MSQLLIRLELECISGNDPIGKAIACARKACYLARVGRYGESSQVIREVRSAYGDGSSGLVTVWLMLAEGVLGLFEKLSPAAFDRIRRAQFLAMALGDRDAIAVTSAWKAHFEFENSQFAPMSDSLRLAVANAESSHHDANARLSMVLSNAFYLLGDRQAGQIWFMRSRDHSLQDGDHAGIEALLYNRAAFSIARLRVRSCFESLPAEALKMARSELNSACNLQNLSAVAALPHLLDLCDARLLVLEGKFEEAIDRLRQVRQSGPFAKYNFDQGLVDLEIHYCSSRCDKCEELPGVAIEVAESDFSSMDVDDQLLGAWMYRELVMKGARFDLIEKCESKFVACANRYAESMKALTIALSPFSGS